MTELHSYFSHRIVVVLLCVGTTSASLVGCNNGRGTGVGPFPPIMTDGGAATMDDGGAPPVTPPPPSSGCTERCDGNTLHYCDGSTEETVDCTDLYPAPATGTCEVIAALGGAICALQPGDACAYTLTSGDDHFAPCAGVNSGCIWTDAGSECRENVGTCASGSDVDCRGSNLRYGCSLGPDGAMGQPLLIDCADIGGTCSAPSCVGLPDAAQCVDPYLLCGEDLECNDAGRCEPDGPVTTIRSCAGSTSSGACTNTSDCGIIDGDPEHIFSVGISCLSATNIGACVHDMTGLSNGCSTCFADPEGSRFRACAGF